MMEFLNLNPPSDLELKKMVFTILERNDERISFPDLVKAINDELRSRKSEYRILNKDLKPVVDALLSSRNLLHESKQYEMELFLP